MKRSQISITALLLRGLLLFSILTILQGVNFLDSVNKIAICALSVAFLLYLLTCTYSLSQIVALFLTAVVHIFALYYTEFPMYHVNMLFYFLLWVLIYFFFTKSKQKVLEELEKSKSYIDFVLWTWTIIVAFSALLPSSYIDDFFISFAGSSFRFMPTALIIAALAMYMAITQKKKYYNLFLIIPTYAAFMNQSRTYFGVYMIFLIMYIYLLVPQKKNFYLLLVPIIIAILMIMSVSGIMDKIIATQYTEKSYYDFWATITSGRTLFWVGDLKAFFELPFWQQFVGNGFNFVYDVNLVAINNEIWAHNDIINMLMNFGYIGVAIYLWSYLQMIRVFWPKGNRIPLMVKILFQGAVFINSMMNMSYTYLCAMISYPLFLCVIEEKYTNKTNL